MGRNAGSLGLAHTLYSMVIFHNVVKKLYPLPIPHEKKVAQLKKKVKTVIVQIQAEKNKSFVNKVKT